MEDSRVRAVDEYIQTHREEIIADLVTLCKIPSVQTEAEEGMPFGKACDEMLTACGELYQKHGFPFKARRQKGYALSEYGDGEKTIGIFGHADVVPPNGEWILTSPFEPVIKDGCLIGRGVEDDKPAVIQALYAMKIIRDLDIPLQSRLSVFVGVTEETGMEDMENFVRSEPMPDCSFVPDAAYPFILGEKTITNFRMKLRKPWESVLSLEGGTCTNAVPGEASVKLPFSDAAYQTLSAELQENADISVTCTKREITVTARGITAHASTPEGSRNAIALLAKAMKNSGAISASDRELMKELERLTSDCYGAPFGIGFSDETFGKLTCVAGMARTENQKTELYFDCRFGTSSDADAIRKSVAEAAGEDMEMEWLSVSQGYCHKEDAPLTVAIKDVYAYFTHGSTEGKIMGGGTYARKLKNAFAIGTEPNDTRQNRLKLPAGHGECHQPDEQITVEGFLKGLKILLFMILAADDALCEK